MKEFLLEISCGIIHIALMFVVVSVELLLFKQAGFSSMPVGDAGFTDLVLFSAASVFVLASIFVSLVLSALAWSKATSFFVSKQVRGIILHRLYRTPSAGTISEWNKNYVNWVLKNT